MLTLFSPAKINLFLRIISKRPDGFHNLSSLFQTLSFGDTLNIELSDRDELTCSDRQLPTDGSNLVLKAVKLFKDKTASQHSFKINLIKRIPTQAGLGGGSSNAATTLWGCNQLTGNKISLETLQHWGAEIGSDVSFFLSHGTAHCTGRGEIIQLVPPLVKTTLLIVKPPEGLSTPSVYQKLRVEPHSAQKDLEDFLAGTLSHFNDLEAPAFELKPSLKELKHSLLQNGFKVALMSGSGSSFFCIGEGKLPSDPTLSIFQTSFLNRTLSEWYAKPL